jgi:hypothetical protein
MLSLFRLLRAPYTLQFLLHSSNCAIQTEEGTAESEIMQFSIHTCTNISRNYIQLPMNIGHFTIADNFVMTSMEKITRYVDIVTDLEENIKPES